jgi:hypothetical protein
MAGEGGIRVAAHTRSCACFVPQEQRGIPMEAGTAGTRSVASASNRSNPVDRLNRFTTETKASFKTSELWLTLAVIAGILVAAATVDGAEGFGANQAWLFVAIMASAYVISRGLAKSGSYEPYAVERDGDVRSNAGN